LFFRIPRHFKWIRDEFPSDFVRSLEFLERCTCDLKSNENLKNDIRFVKMWCEYVSKILLFDKLFVGFFLINVKIGFLKADSVRTPGEIFSFMQSNKIGEKCSLFWIAWAFVAEKAENFNLTDQIFQKGIKRFKN
jgi:hypothetical protein